jgi:hypothetical protein
MCFTRYFDLRAHASIVTKYITSYVLVCISGTKYATKQHAQDIDAGLEFSQVLHDLYTGRASEHARMCTDKQDAQDICLHLGRQVSKP